MPGSHLMRDIVSVLKRDGRRFDGIKAAVQPGKIFTADANAPVEVGDIIEHLAPNGVTYRYVVDDPGYYGAVGSFSLHYQMRVHPAPPA